MRGCWCPSLAFVGFFFYAPASIDRGHIVLPVYVCLTVCLSVRLSAENLTCELHIFLYLQYYSSYKAHIQYAGTFRQHLTSQCHIIKVKVEYHGCISQKIAVSGALVFHKHILFSLLFLFKEYLNPYSARQGFFFF